MKQVATAFGDGLGDIAALLRTAPFIVGLAFAVELAQHIAEVTMGMFASREAFKALQGSPIRMGFGLVKIAGLLLVSFWAARTVAAIRSETRPGLDGPVDWPCVIWTTLVSVAAVLAIMLAPIGSREVRLAAFVVVLIAALPVSNMGMDAVFGRPRLGWRYSLRSRTRLAPGDWAMALPLAAGMALHFQNHNWAFGASPGMVWALMIWDSLLVALLGLMMGVLIHRSYRPPTP